MQCSATPNQMTCDTAHLDRRAPICGRKAEAFQIERRSMFIVHSQADVASPAARRAILSAISILSQSSLNSPESPTSATNGPV
jgi:hypothetical protein